MAKLITVTKAKLKSSGQKHSRIAAKDRQFKSEEDENKKRFAAEKRRRNAEHKAKK